MDSLIRRVPAGQGRRLALILVFALIAALALVIPNATRASAGPCDAPNNPIVCENSKAGVARSTWDISGTGPDNLQGFSTQISVNKGETVRFKIAGGGRYTVGIYRLGWYGGNGARSMGAASLSATLPQNQADCDTDNQTTGLMDCSAWAESASWAVPSTAVSGYYIAKVTGTNGTSGASHIAFVVRDDASTSAMFMQASDSTWQAYNEYGGNSFYEGRPAGRAYKLSYNRPFTTRGDNPEDWLFNAEYPMLRFLERNGYDVSYTTDTDSDRRGSLIKNHKVFLSVGHDEYWSAAQRTNVEAAREAGVNLGFFSGNEVFWKTRYENGGMGGQGDPYRTLVTYKETHENAKMDPAGPGTWTGTWRDPRFSPPADGGRPENALTGQIFTVNCCTTDMTADDKDGKLRLWRNTRLATMAANTETTLGSGTLGYEWDSDLDNGFRPAGQIRLSSTVRTNMDVIQDYGSTYARGSQEHHLTMYRAPSGALVFGAGTIQWAWGLDSARTDGNTGTVDTAMQQSMVNLFADMKVQPGTLMSGMVAATASTDTVKPVSTVTAPVAGQNLAINKAVTVTGTAVDTGGKVGGVEVSVDNGATWHPAQGTRESWTYSFTPRVAGALTLKSRATDDSVNTETPGAGVTVTIGNGGPPPVVNCPCSIWPEGTAPAAGPDPDRTSTEVGVKFQPDRNGWISGVRFYKDAANTGTHTGKLWTKDGTKLAEVTFTDESASGWQQATFSQPVPVTANTTYVASYVAPNGRYSADTGYFAAGGYSRAPLSALGDGEVGANGVYAYGGGFPNTGWESANFYVDVVFTTTNTPPPAGPTVTATGPADQTTGVAAGTNLSAAFNKDVQPATVVWSLKKTADSTAVPGAASYTAATRTAAFDPTADLAPGTSYTASVSGAKDTAGTPMSPVSWTFITAGTPPAPVCAPCTIWPASAVPGTPADNESSAITVGVRVKADVGGKITGVRFYKGTGNSGTHVANLWGPDGTKLAEATFTGETATGWQQVTFSQPVTVTAGAVYTASYYAPNGRYAADEGGLAQQAGTGPVKALADNESGGNGVYKYGTGRPDQTWNSSNYWVDVLFSTP